MTIRIDMRVTKKSRLPGQARAIDDTVKKLVRETADKALDEARKSMRSPKTGRIYPGGHQASAPGQAPAIWHGNLYAMTRSRSISATSAEVTAPEVPGKFLEYGTTKMAPRPFLRPAARKAATWVRTQGPRKVAIKVRAVPW